MIEPTIKMKPIWKSKTLWVNILTLAVLIGGVLSSNPQYGELAKWAALGLPIVNVLLRFVTNQPVTMKRQ